MTYLNKGYDKVIVNFVGIEIICLNYCSFFSSKSKLHKHVKAGCMEKASFSSST